MALDLNISNSLTNLAGELCASLRKKPGKIFQPQFIVTQTAGMNSWLKLEIAAHNGIAANCKFVSPNEIIQRIYYFLGGEFPNALSPQNLSWILYAILGEPEFLARFRSVSDYYNNDSFDKDLKRMALAEKMADLFDQYQIYRPEWIESWNDNEIKKLTGGDWQQYLWLKAKEISKQKLPDKTVMGKHIKSDLKNADKRKSLLDKMPSLHVFGLSIITDYHLELLYEISATADIHFYLVNPAPLVYWFEDRSEKLLAHLVRRGFVDKSETHQGNSLLTSWGRVIQDTFLMLFRNEDLLNRFREVGLSEPEPDTLLHKIQNDIYHSASRDDRNVIDVSDAADGSISINSCYTISREVEAVYNYLVHLVDQRKEKLSPRDIVVMVTDIDAYAPYIKAIFNNAPYKFHFTVADETLASGDTLTNALAGILQLNRANFKAEAILQLLDSSFIRKRFSITNLDLIRQTVDSASIRFGIEGSLDDDSRFVSWEYGIKRIMYGICMSGEPEYIDATGETLFPLDTLEGSEIEQVIRFCHFASVLIDSIRERTRPRKLGFWIEYIERVVRNLICEPEEEIDEAYAVLLEELANFNIADEYLTDDISFEIFSASLLRAVAVSTRAGSFAGGGITFCSLIPMRSIPFKVVAVLGLNLDKFPRKDLSPGFNLIGQDKRRRGDRNVKENDKHLFLDTILSAQEYLYLSYIGQSTKDNTPVPPSALVDELIDYIGDKCDDPGELRRRLIIQHPLHGFSHKYHQPGAVLYNYLNIPQAEIAKPAARKEPLEPINFNEISFARFISFFKHPVKAYYQRALNIFYNEDSILLGDSEVFELNKLQEWKLKTRLVSEDDEKVTALKERMIKTGELPLRNMASVVVEDLENVISRTKKLFQTFVNGSIEQRKPFEIFIDESTLKGTLQHVYDDRLLYISYSKSEYKNLIEAYLVYLIAQAMELNYPMYFISAAQEKIYRATLISKSDAIGRLEDLVKMYKAGHTELIAFVANLDIGPADISKFDRFMLDKSLKLFVDERRSPFSDQYMLNEYEKGSFHADGIMEKYLTYLHILVEPLGKLFPEYFADKARTKKK